MHTNDIVHAALGFAMVGALALAIASPGATAQRHLVRADAPRPAMCGETGTTPPGAWLLNRPCGYYLGMARAGWSFDAQEGGGGNFSFGRIHGGDDFCAWLVPEALRPEYIDVRDGCSAATRAALMHRRTFGRQFDAAPGAGAGGSPAKVDAECRPYFNYFDSSEFAGGSLRDPVDAWLGDPKWAALGVDQVLYSYTTRDGRAMVVRHPEVGWVFVDRACFVEAVGPWTFHEEDD